MRLQYHYRPRQYAVLAALALCWLLLLVLGLVGQVLAGGADLAARGVTTAQARVITNPAFQSWQPEQRVWRFPR